MDIKKFAAEHRLKLTRDGEGEDIEYVIAGRERGLASRKEEQMELEIVEQQDVLAPFRAQVAAEKAEEPNAMSEKAAERLRLIGYEDKIVKQGEEKFAYGLTQIAPTPENLKILITRCSAKSVWRFEHPEREHPDLKQIDRRVAKLGWWISAGYRLGHEIDTPTLINFFSDLVLDEKTMSDREFAATWNAATAAKRAKSRIERGVASIVLEQPPERLCKAGSKCLWAKRRQPAPAAEGSSYCTLNCQKGLAARNRRQKASQKTANAPVLTMNASGDRVNIG